MLPRYIINLEDANLRKAFLDVINKKIKEKIPNGNKENIEKILQELLNLLPQQIVNFQVIIDDIVEFLMFKLNGIQKTHSIMIQIPPLKNNTLTKEVIFEEDIFLTGILATQTGWKKNDSFIVKINEDIFLDNIYLKEVGQFNYFNGVCKLKKGDKITILYKNKEGNSKQFIMDFEFLTLNKK